MTETQEACRLYLIVPQDAGAGFADGFAGALEAGDVACVLLPAALDRALALRLKEIAQARGVAVLVAGDVEAAREMQADGVHIAAGEGLCEQARAALGDAAIIGADAGLSRHLGLVAAEAGADYVAFDAQATPGEHDLPDLISWWAEIVEVPCVGFNVGSADEAGALAERGADFIAMDAALWMQASPQEGVRAFHAVLARARRDAA